MGPEIWKNRPYSWTSDTWAIGCLLYELTTLAVPFEARSMSELRYKVLRGTYPPIPNTFSRDLQQMVRECLDPNPDKRPSMDALLASQAIASRLKLLPHESRHPPPTASSALVDTIKVRARGKGGAKGHVHAGKGKSEKAKEAKSRYGDAVPRGNINAIKNKLPPAQYATDMLLNVDRGGPGQMATIDEGSEDEPVTAHNGRPGALQHPPPPPPGGNARLAPMPAMPPMPRPNYPPPPPPKLPHHLPSLAGGGGGAPSGAASDAGGGYGNRAPQGGLRPPPPPSVAPSSQGGASAWSYGAAAAGPSKAVSESHAYGAFYHHSNYTPNGIAAARPPQQAAPSPWQQGNKWPPGQPGLGQQQQQQPNPIQGLPPHHQYQSPYMSPYGGQQRAYGAGRGWG
ncbi:Serine/threonine-protein kinase Nek4 [Tetrabaena socialis]|uniref:non-specific serine/threonine protein kinase n=1 Tax=Tetrabaena socialis TaxID=47790 RepID=A0A2J7ZIV0_9CHLO|nr:Serine/threonine-protein kinase Nek4 [Tetrabaena socialis]|eukprot:PNH00180.1 Serine/threonine-protein kinase Nek4 [Tetrabaena socialis]